MTKKFSALFITQDNETSLHFVNLFNVHFRGTNVFRASNHDEINQSFQDNKKFELIIIDTGYKVDDFSFLFEELTRRNENNPMVFYGGEALLKSQVPDNIYEHNIASGLLLRPVNVNDFVSTLKRAFSWVTAKDVRESTVSADKESFLPFRIKNFYRFQSIPHHAYIQISDKKYMRVITEDEVYNHSTIHRYVKKGIRYLYFEKKDYLLFLSKAMNDISEVLLKENIHLELILKSQIQAIMIIHEYINTVGANDEVSDFIKLLISTTLEQFKKAGSLGKIIKAFPYNNRDIAEKSILTSYVCIALLNELEWNAELTKQKLGLASIFYDALLEDDSLDVCDSLDSLKVKEEFSEEQIEEYRNHPERSAQAVSFLSGFSEVGFIILQHHEQPNGLGFPRGSNSHQLTHLVCLFIIANNFVSQLMIFGNNSKTLALVLEKLLIRYNHGHFKKVIVMLKRMLIPPKASR